MGKLATLCLLFFMLLNPSLADEKSLWSALDREVQEAIKDGQTTGATLLVGRGQEILYFKSYGMREIESREAVTERHQFDAASLTKPLVTAVSVLLLVQDGKIALQDPIDKYLPLEWEVSPTVAQVLSHHSGLPAGLENEGFPESLFKTELEHQPGSRFLYSDVGYLLLGKLVEKQSGLSLEEFYRLRVAEPLDLKNSSFGAAAERAIPTYGVPKGQVHDPRARLLEGVAGHAGLFTTAHDVHQELSQLHKILNPQSMQYLFLAQEAGRSYGMDVDTRFSTARGERFSPLTSAGHTGFTGPSFWWDKPTGIHVILMASRLYPDDKGDVVQLRSRLATLVAEHFLGSQVQTGLDALRSSDFESLKSKRVGFVLNQTSRDRFGRHLVDLLPAERDFDLVSFFTPEHGLLGVRDEKIEHGHHLELDIPVYSLYGDSREPKLEWLQNLDVLVFDLQDVGVRYYTYISTLKACLEVAKLSGTEILVLDRPNPLGGVVVDGHIAQNLSFIACDELPLVHGMTMGELALFLNRNIGAKLRIEKMKAWQRSMTWQDTGLSLLSPSPNLAELEAIQLYPVLGQLEWCELSVGRGTRSPFRVIGAPYIKDPQALASLLNEQLGPTLAFRPRFFIPESSTFQGQLCGGVEVSVTEQLLHPAQQGLALARALNSSYTAQFKIEKMRQHLASEDLDFLFAQAPDNQKWLKIRAPFLLYP